METATSTAQRLVTSTGRAASFSRAKDETTMHFLDEFTDANGNKSTKLDAQSPQRVTIRTVIKDRPDGSLSQAVIIKFSQTGKRVYVPIGKLFNDNLLVPEAEGSDVPVLISDTLGYRIAPDGAKSFYAI